MMRVMIDREGYLERNEFGEMERIARRQRDAANMTPQEVNDWIRKQQMGAMNGIDAYERKNAVGMQNTPSPQQLRLRAAKVIATAARDRQPTACETCECDACQQARMLPRVLNILAAAERRMA